MVEREVVIRNPSGLHTRPAKRFVNHARRFACATTVWKRERQADAKSLLRVLKLGISQGQAIRLTCQGADELEALDSLVAFLAELDE